MTTHAKLDIMSCIQSNPLVIFSKTTCPSSTRVKRILMQYIGIQNFNMMELDMDPSYHESTMEDMEKLFHVNTTPCIFMNGSYVSTDEFETMHDKGILQQKFIDIGVLPKTTSNIPHNSALLSVATNQSYDDTCSSITKIVPLLKYGILHNYNLTQTLQSKGQNFTRPVSVYEICNPAHAAHVLSSNPSISSALPCRISIWQHDDTQHTMIQTMKPSIMIDMLGGENNQSLTTLANQVENDLYNIMLQCATNPHH